MTEYPDGSARAPGPVIWLVDDDRILCQALAATLEVAGYRVVQFSSSTALLNRADAGAEIDMLITDIKLGAQPHGVSLVVMMRSLRADLPCLLITARDEIPDDIVGGVAVLRKPIDLTRFAADVRAVLGR